MHRLIIIILSFRSNEKKSEIWLIIGAKEWADNYDKDNCDLSSYKL